MRQIARLAVAVVGATGVVVIFGWYTGLTALTKLPGFPSMKPTPALLLLLIAVGALLISNRRVALVLGALAAVLGALTLLELAFDIEIGVDTLLAGIEYGDDSARMAPATALVLLFLGAALATSARARPWVSHGLALLALCGSQVAFLGYVYGASSLFGLGGFAALAPQTFVCTIILGLSLLVFRHEESPIGLLQDRGSAGSLLRWAIPFFIAGPFVLGLARLWGQQADLYDTNVGVVILVMAMTVLGCTVSWVAAVRLRTLDRLRDNSAAELLQANAGLESAVT